MNLELRPWLKTDSRAVQAIMSQVDRRFLSDGLPDPYGEENAREWLELVHQWEGKQALCRAIVADGDVVGMISCHRKADVSRLDGELSYCLLPQAQGKGIMTRAVDQFCRLAFEQWNIVRISASVFANNWPSRCVLEKNGFHWEGTLHNAICKGENLQDLCLYGKYREEQS